VPNIRINSIKFDHGKSETGGKWKIKKNNARKPKCYLASGILPALSDFP